MYNFMFQVRALTVLATLVKYTTDENEVRILYAYLAEASVVFSKVCSSLKRHDKHNPYHRCSQ